MSSVLAKVDTNIETLSKLKILLHMFMGSVSQHRIEYFPTMFQILL
jgi:hypothetical protein